MRIKRLLKSWTWKLTPIKIRKRNLARAIFRSAERTEKLEGLSNVELAEYIRANVFYDMEMFTPMSDLIGEILERLDPNWSDRIADDPEVENFIDDLLKDNGQ
jgi:hypothetical protein